jgi:RNA polymerase sigma-70 factor (ECF subfamily)
VLTLAAEVWLLAAAARGDQAAFARFYGATCAKVYGAVLRIVQRRDLAEEVLEATYLQAWQSAGGYDPSTMTPMAWLVRLARPLAIDAVRLRLPASGADQGEPTETVEMAGGETPRRETSEELKRLLGCIGRLEGPNQRMLLLAYFGGLSREQLAAQIDLPVNSIRPILHRSLAEIRTCLES